MSDIPPSAGSAAPSRRTVWRNWISFAGIVISGGAMAAFLLLFAIDRFSGGRNPYIGILSYVVAPGFLVLGLAVAVLGALVQRWHRKHHPGAATPRLYIDLERPRDRKVLVYFGAGTVAFLLLTALGSYQTYQITESVAFCGQVCHTVMEPEYTTYKRGAHARVACVECHIGSGATWYVKSKLSGSYQLYSVTFHKYSTPIPTPVANLRPAQETCEQCHWPERFSGNLDRTYTHFLSDDKNTPFSVRLILHVGGGSPEHGPAGGIHWHMNVANKVEYYATDPQRQKIPWIRITDRQGIPTVYHAPDFKGDPPPNAIRTMDCIDCHSRPAHAYQTPNDAVEEGLALGRIDSRLPDAKRVIVDLLTAGYANDAEAIEKIAAGMRRKFAGTANLEPSIVAAANIYRGNFFPEMKADWSKYPDNIGHKNFPGCFRCHDNLHEAVGDPAQKITGDCNACHTIIAQGAGAQLSQIAPAGLVFKHPSAEIEGLGLLCSDCHNGKSQEN